MKYKNISNLSIGERLKYLMEQKGCSKAEFCSAVNISIASLYRYEKGERDFKISTIIAICNFFNISTDYFLTGIPSGNLSSTERECLNKLKQMSPSLKQKYLAFGDYLLNTSNDFLCDVSLKKIPILGRTACGEPIQAIEYYDETIETDNEQADYALKAEGDSMNPYIKDGDLILVKQQDEIENGEIGIFQINNNDGFFDDNNITCKKYKYEPNIPMIILKSINQEYDDIYIFPYKDGSNFRVLGKVLGTI